MLLYTSTFAPFVLLAGLAAALRSSIRDRGVRAIGKPGIEDVPFHAFAVLLIFAVLTVKPVLHMLFILFQGTNFTHARIVIAGLLPLCTLVAMSLQALVGALPAARTMKDAALVTVAPAVVAMGVVAVLSGLAQRVEWLPISLDDSPSYIQQTVARLMVIGRGWNEVAAPKGLVANAVSPTEVRLDWRPVNGATDYRVDFSMPGWDTRKELPRVPGATAQYDVGGLHANTRYGFSVRACREEQCSANSVELWVTTLTHGPPLGPRVRPSLHSTVYLLSTAAVYWGWSVVALGSLLCALWIGRRSPTVRAALALTIGFLLLIDCFWHADSRFNGRSKRFELTALSKGDIVLAEPDTFHPPATDALAALRERLDTDKYRSVVLCDYHIVPVFCAPHLAFFWRLRLVDGYSVGIPKRLAALPWPENILSLRTLTFSRNTTMPWPLLSLLNVRQALAISPAFYMNAASSTAGAPAHVPPFDTRIIDNPIPAIPRQFFAQGVAPVGDATEAARRLFPDGSPDKLAIDVRALSLVEGMSVGERYTDEGTIEARYHGDTIDISVTSVAGPRFLVLNELYHPAWRAYADGREIAIYPTNVVMRGLVVPAGTTQISLRFVPFFHAQTAFLGFASGLVLVMTCAVVFRLISRAAGRVSGS
jgi:hypothetical protein